MWVYSHALEDWRFYLVTSLVETIGRRKTYKLLLDAFECIKLPEEMTVEDVYLGSPMDDFFRLISSSARVDEGEVRFKKCSFDGIAFDGVVYRSVREVPKQREAERIEKRFSKRVKELISHGA